MNDEELIEQLCKDLNQAHDELMKAQGIENPETFDWPEWTPQANTIREAEKRLGKKLAKTDIWSMFPEKKLATFSGDKPQQHSEVAPGPIDSATGKHTDYWVLPDEDRLRGFVRPLRFTYIHTKCGKPTTMGAKIAETFAADPEYYGSTFCAHCRDHFPCYQFRWSDGSIVGK